MKWEKIREQFPYLKNNHKEIYFDSAATSLKPAIVCDAEKEYYETINANPHSTDYKNAYNANQILKQTRELVRDYIHAENVDEIVFTSGATFGLNQIAFGLKDLIQKDDEILITDLEHSSNIVPWIEVARLKGAKIKEIPLNKEYGIDLEALAKLVHKKTRVISFAPISNTMGTKNDVTKITALVKSINPDIIVCVDGAQSIGHQKIDVIESDIDFLAFSAHKMYGPYGVGVLYGKKQYLNQLIPLIYGGGMSLSVDLNKLIYDPTIVPGKLEAGTPDIAGIYAFSKAIEFINKIGIENIENYETDLKLYARAKIKNTNLSETIDFYNLENDSPILLFNVKGINPQDIAGFLNNDYHIDVRSGALCARLTQKIGYKISIRASFGIYNSPAEIDKLIEALQNSHHFLDYVLKEG